MNPLVRSALLAALLLSTVASAEDASPKAPATPKTVDIDQARICAPVDVEFIKRIAVARPRHFTRDGFRVDSARAATPSWMLSRMVVLVPDGTPQLTFRAPSAQRGSPDFGH
ncbi:hypothetical protein JY651_49325 [Pyxidicoccus parkwayensis]|uniref:Uncharacterized protein n=1 Tax=Pyxidicoccus parkwayensis TaxID=2813578 RepID=A0ABX7P043_9BACT|nr:hypothetical protein [Pyxidicoccus parkwaysis]QSQ23011.1 hypothetical protein JY651_49325 [Pyxidicoccus parkwaysis]